MVNKLRVIIGQGTATEVYRATVAPADGFDTVVIGPRGLWAALPGDHRMGQTPNLLALPGQPTPSATSASGQSVPGLNDFLDVNTYQQGLLALARKNDQRPGTISSVGTGTGTNKQQIQLDSIRARQVGKGIRSGQIKVYTTNPGVTFNADQVIIATGIGPQSKPNPPDGVSGQPDTSLGYPQLMEGIEYLNAPPPYGREVAVFGGSATAAWVAAEAIERSRRLLWFTRPGGSEFRGCTLPGDRNYMILDQTKDLRLLAELRRIDYLPAKRIGTTLLRRPMVKLTLRPTSGDDKICLVDQLIYSIGGNSSDPHALQNLIAREIRSTLQPLRDHNRVLGDDNGVLAISTPDRSLIIIGAAAYNYSQPEFNKQAAPVKSLPTASQVPDGIAMIVASVQAVNNYIPLRQDSQGNITESNLNLNLADRNQLAVYIAAFFPAIAPAAANTIVEQVIAQRSSGAPGKAFGLTEKDFESIIQRYA
jgi:hypothetical protein